MQKKVLYLSFVLFLLAGAFTIYTVGDSQWLSAEQNTSPESGIERFTTTDEASSYAGFDLIEPTIPGWSRANEVITVRKLDQLGESTTSVDLTFAYDSARVSMAMVHPAPANNVYGGVTEPVRVRGVEGLLITDPERSPDMVGIWWNEGGANYFAFTSKADLSRDGLLEFVESLQ